MIKVVSTALFGEGDKYSQYLPAFVLGTLNLFPREDGWRLRVHFNSSASEERRTSHLLARMADAGLVDLILMPSAPLTKAMMWRMLPVFDKDVSHVLCRDLDACPMPRDRACSDQFIASDATVGTIHDNVAHAGIMGGLCNFHASKFRAHTGLDSLDGLYARAATKNEVWAKHGTDQDVLNRLINRLDGPTLLEHRYAGWHAGPGTNPKRGPGVYNCPAWSTPVPDVGVSALSPELSALADRLGNHLGCAGYDHETARKFWEEHGDPQIARLVGECGGTEDAT